MSTGHPFLSRYESDFTNDCISADLEKVLVDLGAIDEHDSRLKKRESTPPQNDSDEEYLDDWD